MVQYRYHVYVNVLEDEDLKRYAERINVDYEDLTNTENPTAILLTKITFTIWIRKNISKKKRLN